VEKRSGERKRLYCEELEYWRSEIGRRILNGSIPKEHGPKFDALITRAERRLAVLDVTPPAELPQAEAALKSLVTELTHEACKAMRTSSAEVR
jgi:hypothetical protein